MVALQWPEGGTATAKQLAVGAMLDWAAEGIAQPVFVLIPNPPTPVDRAEVAAAAGDGLVYDVPAATFAVATTDRARALACAVLLFESLVDQLSIVALDGPPPASAAKLRSWVDALQARPFHPEHIPPLRGVVFDWGTPLEVLGPDGARIVDPKLLGQR